jgi:hypothetical protein
LFASIAVRLATANDREALERPAELDWAETPSGSTLVGERLERPVAALSLSDGRVIADPFVATADLVVRLRLERGSSRSGVLDAAESEALMPATTTQPTPARHRPQASHQPNGTRRHPS